MKFPFLAVLFKTASQNVGEEKKGPNLGWQRGADCRCKATSPPTSGLGFGTEIASAIFQKILTKKKKKTLQSSLQVWWRAMVSPGKEGAGAKPVPGTQSPRSPVPTDAPVPPPL